MDSKDTLSSLFSLSCPIFSCDFRWKGDGFSGRINSAFTKHRCFILDNSLCPSLTTIVYQSIHLWPKSIGKEEGSSCVDSSATKPPDSININFRNNLLLIPHFWSPHILSRWQLKSKLKCISKIMSLIRWISIKIDPLKHPNMQFDSISFSYSTNFWFLFLHQYDL